MHVVPTNKRHKKGLGASAKTGCSEKVCDLDFNYLLTVVVHDAHVAPLCEPTSQMRLVFQVIPHITHIPAGGDYFPCFATFRQG